MSDETARLRAALSAASLMLLLVDSKRRSFFATRGPETTEALDRVRQHVSSALAEVPEDAGEVLP